MDRRSVLASAGGALTLSLGGCLGTNFGRDTETSPRPWTASTTTASPDGTHHLVVENHTDATRAAWLRVSEREGATLVDGRYELPDGRGIEFAELAGWETAYTIELAVDGGPTTTFSWTTPTCGADAEVSGQSGSRNATVLVEASAGEGDEPQASLVVDECDGIYSHLPAGPAASHRLDE